MDELIDLTGVEEQPCSRCGLPAVTDRKVGVGFAPYCSTHADDFDRWLDHRRRAARLRARRAP